MKIGTKVNWIFITFFLIGILITGIALANVLERQAKIEVTAKAEILMQIANSVRGYINDRVQPLLLPKEETEEQFVAQAIPSFATREVFENLRKNTNYATYLYKDAILNPTNLRDKADAFEIEIAEEFSRNPGLNITSGWRMMSGKKLFYSARPFIIKNQTCLRCHTTPEQAPKSQIATYGKNNGFGWNLNKILGSQIVYVPAEDIFKTASRLGYLILGVIGIIFTAIIIIMNQLLKKTVLQRIKRIAIVAEQVSVGDMNTNFGKQSKDEIGNLAEAFNRMKYSLEIALNMLNSNQK